MKEKLQVAIIIVFFTVICGICYAKEQNERCVIILANSIDVQHLDEDEPKNLMGFLRNRAFNVIIIKAEQFEKYKTERKIVILGGPDAPEGVGEIVQQLLTEEEQKEVREKGSRKMFVKTNVFTRPQQIFIFAGSDREGTKASQEENKGEVE